MIYYHRIAGKKVVVCDSNPINRSILKVVLETRGFGPVYKACCAYQAIEIMQRMTVDLVITNLQLRGSGGEELAERIRSVDPDTRILVYSTMRKCTFTNADRYIYGPLTDLENLLDACFILIARKRGPKIPPTVANIYRTPSIGLSA